MDIVSHQKIRRFEAGTFQEIESSVATEYPLTIYVNDQELVTIVCTPEYLEDLVVGFLTSEGIVRVLKTSIPWISSKRLDTPRLALIL